MTTLTTPARTSSTARRIAGVLGAALITNLLLLAFAAALDASLIVDNNGTLMSVGAVEVVLASLIPLGLGIAAYVLVGNRFGVVRRLWTPAVIVVTLLSFGGLLGASDATTGFVLAGMHIVVGGLAAFAVPRTFGNG